MAYVHQVSFDIPSKDVDELRIGSALQRVLGYLRVLLPSQPGFVTARALYSVDKSDRVHLVVQSEWATWRELEAHSRSGLSEEKVLREFEPVAEVQNLAVEVLAEVS